MMEKLIDQKPADSPKQSIIQGGAGPFWHRSEVGFVSHLTHSGSSPILIIIFFNQNFLFISAPLKLTFPLSVF